jgi:hypothetical protein
MEIFEHIPKYVFAIFALLIYLGYKRCFPRTIQVKRLFIFPVLFIFLSVKGKFAHIQLIDAGLWFVGACVGIGLGFLHVSKYVVRADHDKKLIQLPGDWTMLVLLLVIFAFKFFIGYSAATDAAVIHTFWYKYIIMIVFGVITGMTIGRNLSFWCKYRSTVSQNLTESK